MEREKLGSRLGFILLSAGCAIGCGNVWKFPWMCGEYGGGAFVLLYLLFLIILGLPVMIMEFSVGRASQASVIKSYQSLEKPGQKWHYHGIAAFIGNLLLMMFYTSVAGWILYYFISFVKGDMTGITNDASSQLFDNMLTNVPVMVGFMAIVVILGFVILSFSLQKGLERITKYMMVLMLALMVILAIRGFWLGGAKEGLTFYLKPDLSKINGNVIVGAMNQSFFTLSLGIGSMAIFGSYIGKDRSLMGESINILVLDTFVALVAGLIIFPACFTFDVEAGAGPSLLFVAMAKVFNNMTGGRIWGSLFFLFMFFAAMSTVLAVFENILACVREITGWKRIKACIICCAAMLILALPCALGYNIFSNFHPFNSGSTILDFEDFIVSNCLLPIGSLVYILFCTSKKGWGFDNFIAEANTGKGLKVARWLKPYLTYVLPLIIVFVFIMGIITFKFADNFTILGWLKSLIK
ncbi:MAG: sodium-dependent transporter [Clostridia bacterium]|nr:sodium-dependent transporter [Clostridia bacterium]